MKWDDLYPDSPEWHEPEGENIFLSRGRGPCWHCGQMTNWVDFSFETYLCSQECSDTKWAEYFKALSGQASSA